MKDNEIMSLLHQINKSYRFAGQPQDEICNKGEQRILRILSGTDGISQRELAERLSIRPQSLTRMLAKMEEEELLVRRQGAEDHRMNCVFLTEKGRETYLRTDEQDERKAGEFLSVLSETEKEQLYALLYRLRQGIPDEYVHWRREDKQKGSHEFRHGSHGKGRNSLDKERRMQYETE